MAPRGDRAIDAVRLDYEDRMLELFREQEDSEEGT